MLHYGDHQGLFVLVFLFWKRYAGLFGFLRRLLLGAPIPSSRHEHERLNKFLALPVFSSDAVSSVAYASQEILLVLIVAGAVAWRVSFWIALCIAGLIAIVTISYRQTIHAYPQGGGSYTVAKENLGTFYGLIAAASLLTDYVLTVSVSVAAGVEAIVSLHQGLAPHAAVMGVAAVFIVAYMNLRGLRESGSLFAGPTYAFIILLYTLLGVGLYKVITGHVVHVVTDPSAYAIAFTKAEGKPILGIETLSAFLILRAFSSGCSALTGIEAIANGVPAFRAPESRNAATTMTYMATILATLVLGVTYLANAYHVFPAANETVISQIARTVFGRGAFWVAVQVATALILILAANTAFQDFPRLSSILARDRFAPRQLTNIGDKLVFSNGIILLSIVAALLIYVFGGKTSALIPLYAVGVFISFTLSQVGMGVRQMRLKHQGWRLHSAVSFFGGFVTFIVTCVTAVVKLTEGPVIHVGRLGIPTGAYFVLILIPCLVILFYKIHKHYITMGNQLRLTKETFKEPPTVRSTSIVLTSSIHAGILPALEYARTLSHDCRALFVEIDPIETRIIRERWEEFGLGVPLVILESPYRSMIGPVIKYLEEVKKERPDYVVTVVLPEIVPKKWWHKLLHNQSALMLKIALMMRRGIVFTNVRYYLEQ